MVPGLKIAEALAERAGLDKKIRSLLERAKAAARYAEGEEPLESATELLNEARDAIKRQAQLVAAINLTNAATELEPDVTLTAALAKRAALTAEAAAINAIAVEATGGGRDIYRLRRRTELPEKTDLPVRELRAEADRIAAEHRALDVQIQQANWQVDLI